MLNTQKGNFLITIVSFITGNFFVSFFLATSLSQIWSLINTLQIIVKIPLILESTPNNAVILLEALNTLTNFDVLPYQRLEAALFEFDKDYSLNDQFEYFGYRVSFIYNIQSFYYVINLVILLMIMSKLLTYF